MNSEFIEIGTLLKPHGFKGKIELKWNYRTKDNFTLASFFVESLPTPLPYFIEELKENKSVEGHFFVQLEDIDSLELAKKLKGKKIYCQKEQLAQVFDTEYEEIFSILSLIGYQLIDQENNVIGEISDVFENAMNQYLFQVFSKQKEILIPFVETQILEIDEEKSILKYTIPEGLLDIYLNS